MGRREIDSQRADVTCKASTCKDPLPLSEYLQNCDIPDLWLVVTRDKGPAGWSMKDIPVSPSGLTALLQPLLQHLRLDVHRGTSGGTFCSCFVPLMQPWESKCLQKHPSEELEGTGPTSFPCSPRTHTRGLQHPIVPFPEL